MKRSSHLDPMTMLLLGFSVVMSVSSQLMLRLGMSALAGESGSSLLLRAASSPWVVGGLVVYAAGTLAWLVVLSRIDLAVAYPLGALNYVLITVLAALLLHEQIPLLRWIGTSVILSGILTIARGERRSQDAVASEESQ